MHKRLKIADYQRKIAELEAQLASTYHFASVALNNASDKLQGGAVIVRLTALGGKDCCVPFAVKNGLSADTIAALRADINRSYADAIAFKPHGFTEQPE